MSNEESILKLQLSESNIQKIYSEDSIHYNRYIELIEKFYDCYSVKPQFICRAPGRVNIIGEHICYVEDNHRDCMDVEIRNYTEKTYTLSFKDMIDFLKPHDWINYVIAGFNSIQYYMKNKHLTFKLGKNVKMLVTGNVPFSSGLSSSSALTVVSALTMVEIAEISNNITKFELAETTINYERSVGTACGGMDQTISVYADKGSAKLIEFCPKLSLKTVNLPDNVSFVIANSLTESTKIDTLAFRYNKRVVENKLGIAIICKKVGIELLPILYDLKIRLNLSYHELNKLIEDNLKPQYDLNTLYIELGSLDIILKEVPYYKEVLDKNTSFNLKNRLLHVSMESSRVEEFYKICNDNNPDIYKLGNLMNSSHISCRDLYECSSTELDKLVEYSLENKALGARLTGAGWGGCCVIMLKNQDVSEFMENIKYFYINKNKKDNDFNYFLTNPSQGALVLFI